jgi:hypothetical protein
MRSKLTIATLSVVLAVAGGTLMASNATGGTVLHVVVITAGYGGVAIDDANGDGRLRLGDGISARGPLFDSTQSIRVGTSYLQCIVHRRIVDPDQGLWNCNYVLELEGGDIVLQGLDPRGPGEYEMAVLGGTGAFAGASGDATFTDVGPGGETYTDIVIRLSD